MTAYDEKEDRVVIPPWGHTQSRRNGSAGTTRSDNAEILARLRDHRAAMWTYTWIADRAAHKGEDRGTVSFSVPELAEGIGLSLSSAKNHLRVLLEKVVLKTLVPGKKGAPTIYLCVYYSAPLGKRGKEPDANLGDGGQGMSHTRGQAKGQGSDPEESAQWGPQTIAPQQGADSPAPPPSKQQYEQYEHEEQYSGTSAETGTEQGICQRCADMRRTTCAELSAILLESLSTEHLAEIAPPIIVHKIVRDNESKRLRKWLDGAIRYFQHERERIYGHQPAELFHLFRSLRKSNIGWERTAIKANKFPYKIEGRTITDENDPAFLRRVDAPWIAAIEEARRLYPEQRRGAA